MAEEHKNALRQVRRDANQRLKKLVKNKELSEDLEHDLEADVQETTDAYAKRIGDIAVRKESGILSI